MNEPNELSRVTRRNRQMIYVSDTLRKVLKGRKEPLSVVVTMLAERYLGMLERTKRTPPYCLNGELYENVLKEAGHPLTSAEIATFPVMCEDWLKRNPEFPQGPGATAVMILKNSGYHDLVALVDKMERNL